MNEDLIDIPSRVDGPRDVTASQTTTFVGIIGQTVRFDDPNPPTCWAHTAETRVCGAHYADCVNHGCPWPGDGRLGLCHAHEGEILG